MTIKNKDISKKIYSIIKRIGLPTDFILELKTYSKRYLGRYNPNNSKVIVYVMEEENKIMDIDYLMENIIHECIHHYQWKHEKNFTRLHGVMHNEQFKLLEKKYIEKYYRLKKLGVFRNATKIKNDLEQHYTNYQ